MTFFFTGLLLLFGLFAGFAQDQKPILPPQKITSCSLVEHDIPGNPSTDRDAALMAIYNNQARLVHSIKAVAVIHATRGPKFGSKAGTSHPITGFFDFEQPASLRVTGVAPPMGRKVFDLASDGREFRLFAPDHDIMKLYVGLVDAQPNFSAISVPEISDIARPREILDALRWQEGTLRKSQSSTASGSDSLEFDLPPRAGNPIIGKLKFDPQTGALASLQIHDVKGELISEVFYADWQPVADDTSHGCFPRRVRLVQPMEDVQLDFRFLEMTLNPHLSRINFRISTAPGTPVIHLSPAGAAKEL